MITLNANLQPEPYTFVLSTKSHEHIGVILNTIEENCNIFMNSPDEISFAVYKYLDEENQTINPLWDQIKSGMYVYVPELNEYFDIEVNTNENETTLKSISGQGAAEVELAQSLIYSLEINTEIDIERDDYISATVFYDDLDHSRSLLHRALDKLPQWSIGHVDYTLNNIQRMFSVNQQDVYSFLTQTVGNEVGCLFKFDSVERTISAYDLKTVCIDCGHRGEFQDVCPECESKNLRYYGEDTAIYIDHENFAKSVTLTTLSDQLKNTFCLEAGDENMTAAIRNLNPNGSNYLYYFSDEQKAEMPLDLVSKIEEYDALVDTYRAEYTQLTEDIYEAIDKISYYTVEMMPEVENVPTNAETEAAKLTVSSMSPVGLPNLSSYTSTATVNTAVEQLAKSVIKSGWFKVKVKESTFTYVGQNADEMVYGTWNGILTVTSYSDDEDIADSNRLTITIADNYYHYVEQKIQKMLADPNYDKEGSIFDVLKLKDKNEFKDALTYYGLNRLQSFADAVQGCIDIMIETGQSTVSSEMYEELYLPYYNKLQLINAEMDRRQHDIDEWQDLYDDSIKRKLEIQELLNFQNFLGPDLSKTFCIYKRENVYSNQNYISDDLETAEIMENAQMFLNAAQEELYKAGNYQYSLSGDLIDFLAIPEFGPFMDSFQLGNFIRVGIDDKVYRLRLVRVSLNWEDITTIGIEFSDVTKTINGASDISSILSKSKQMSTSYNATVGQVRKSKEQTDMMRDFVNRGLDTTLMKIVNNADRQDVVIGSSGVLARRKSDFENVYDDYQLKILNNGVYTTEDSWRSTSLAMGKYVFIDPDTGEQSIRMGVIAENIVGSLILGKKLGIYSSDNTSTMSFDNFGLRLNVNNEGTGNDPVYKRIFEISVDGSPVLYVDNDGVLRVHDSNGIEVIQRVNEINAAVANIEKAYIDQATIETLLAEYAKIERLEVVEGNFENLTAENGRISNLETNYLTVNNTLTAHDARIVALQANSITTGDFTAYKAQIENLFAQYATIEKLESEYITTENIEATYASIEQLQADRARIDTLEAGYARVDELVAEKATITDLNAANANIQTLHSQVATIETVLADKVDTKELTAQLATITELHATDIEAVNGEFQRLESVYATFGYVDAENITTRNLIAEKATITDLNAANAQIGNLQANYANIRTILSGNIGTGQLTAIQITANNAVFENAVIKDAAIDSLSASKITAGRINTSEITIGSENGPITLTDSTQTFKDSEGNIRLQIGQDAEGNFNFIIKNGSNAVLIDETGIKDASAIANGLIKDSHVANNANISGYKLDVDSVITCINNNNTTTLSASKIWMDGENQSLGAKFSQITTALDATVKTMTPYYAVNNSATTAPSSSDSWSTAIPVHEDNEYVWRKEKIIKVDDSVSWTTPYCITGASGQDSYFVTINSSEGTVFSRSSEKTQTTLYCAVYKGNEIITPVSYDWYIYDGSNWVSLNHNQASYACLLSSIQDVGRYKVVVEV